MVSFHFEALCSLRQPAHVLAARANRPTGKQSGDDHCRDEQERPRCRPARRQRVAAMKAPTSMTAEANRERRRDSWTATVYSATRSDASPMSRYPSAHCPRAMADTTQKTAVGWDRRQTSGAKSASCTQASSQSGFGHGRAMQWTTSRGPLRPRRRSRHVSVRDPRRFSNKGRRPHLHKGIWRTASGLGGRGASEWSFKWTVTAGESTATAWPDREGREIYDLWMSPSNNNQPSGRRRRVLLRAVEGLEPAGSVTPGTPRSSDLQVLADDSEGERRSPRKPRDLTRCWPLAASPRAPSALDQAALAATLDRRRRGDRGPGRGCRLGGYAYIDHRFHEATFVKVKHLVKVKSTGPHANAQTILLIGSTSRCVLNGKQAKAFGTCASRAAWGDHRHHRGQQRRDHAAPHGPGNGPGIDPLVPPRPRPLQRA